MTNELWSTSFKLDRDIENLKYFVVIKLESGQTLVVLIINFFNWNATKNCVYVIMSHGATTVQMSSLYSHVFCDTLYKVIEIRVSISLVEMCHIKKLIETRDRI